MQLRFTDRDGHRRALAPGGRVPGDGTVTVTLTNTTASPRLVGVGLGATGPLASSLDRLYDAARAPKAAVPPYAGSGLPTTVPGAHQGDEQLTVSAPLRVTGSIGVAETGAVVRGAGATPSATGAAIAGTLDGSTSWDIDVRSGQHLKLDLAERPLARFRGLADLLHLLGVHLHRDQDPHVVDHPREERLVGDRQLHLLGDVARGDADCDAVRPQILRRKAVA